MNLFPLSHVGALLGIDPKTLRLWLHEADLTAIPHPEDARQKCLSLTQIQQVADTHGRHLPPTFTSSAAPPPRCLPQMASPNWLTCSSRSSRCKSKSLASAWRFSSSRSCAHLPWSLLRPLALFLPPLLPFLPSLMRLLHPAPHLAPFP